MRFVLVILTLLTIPRELFCATDEPAPVYLDVTEGEITIDGKRAKVLNITQPDGTMGYFNTEDAWFNVIVRNRLSEPTVIHWHGLLDPYKYDGVPYISQLPIEPGKEHAYQFQLKQSGTYFMHSHYCFQEQLLMTAPLILYPKAGKGSEQEVVILLEDFSFTTPEKIFYNLRHPHDSMPMQGMDGADLNDVQYDAYLSNRKTLSNPETIEVTPNTAVRLRIINGAAATNFFVTIGEMSGTLIAVDGNPIEPLAGAIFQIAAGQRIDIMAKIPDKKGVYPVLAIGEGAKMQTGVILHTSGSAIPQIPPLAQKAAGALNYEQEWRLHARSPLARKPIDRSIEVKLGGDMQTYVWTINGAAYPQTKPLPVKKGERVELVFVNQTGMSHPMHLHGHQFQVTEIDGKPLSGALRDTVLVKPQSTVKVQFDADNPGLWFLHCHILYHMIAGMATTIQYDGLENPYTDVPCFK